MIVRLRSVVVILLLLGLISVEAWRTLTPPATLREGGLIVEIPAHLSLPSIAERLWRSGAIRSPEAFVALSLAHGSYRTLRAGEYEIPPAATTSDVLRLLESGHVRRHLVL